MRKRRTGVEINMLWSGLLMWDAEEGLLKAQGAL